MTNKQTIKCLNLDMQDEFRSKIVTCCMCEKHCQSTDTSESKDETDTENHQKNFSPFMQSNFFLEGLLVCD